MKARVKFIGYQNGFGKVSPFALFDVLDRTHTSYKSTLSTGALIKIGLEIPPHPTYIQWVTMKDKSLAWKGIKGIV